MIEYSLLRDLNAHKSCSHFVESCELREMRLALILCLLIAEAIFLKSRTIIYAAVTPTFDR